MQTTRLGTANGRVTRSNRKWISLRDAALALVVFSAMIAYSRRENIQTAVSGNAADAPSKVTSNEARGGQVGG